MRIPNLGETELLVPLQEGVFEQPMWATFLHRLKRIANATAAGLIVRLPGGREALRLGDRAAALDRMAAADLREGRVYAQSELAVTIERPASELRAIRLVAEGGAEAVLVLQGERLEAEHARLLTALGPYLRVALRVLHAMETERARATLSADALSRMNFGWIALDERCRIIACDPQAERFLAQSTAVRRGPYHRLIPQSAQADRQLTAVVGDLARDPKARPRAINLSHDPWLEVLVSPPPPDALAGDRRPAAMVYLRADRSSSADRHEQLGDLFDLTPAEARLAWSLSQGLSIAEAAAEHGLTLETARYYSKRIYAKTGARGQVDLVRNILTGVLALA